MNSNYTVILGAEGEMGKALAREVAGKGCNLILISTTSIDLLRFEIGLQLKHDIQVHAMKLDLSNQDEIHELTRRIKDQYEVRALINNITCDWSARKNMCISELATDDFQTRFRGAALFTMNLLHQMNKNYHCPGLHLQLHNLLYKHLQNHLL